jgi:hypothetical protein
VVVLEHDLERNVLRQGFGGLGGRYVKLDFVARFDPVCRVFYRPCAYPNFAFEKKLLPARATEVARMRGEKAIEPRTYVATARHRLEEIPAGLTGFFAHAMTQSNNQDDQPLDPAQEAIVRRLRRLMVLSSLIMLAGFLVVFGVIGYRLFTAPQQDSAIEANVSLPTGARVLSTAASDGQLIVTIEVGGAIEVRTFDLSTLKQTGRMTFQSK